MTELTFARVPVRRLTCVAVGLALAVGIFVHAATQAAAANTSVKVGYISYAVPPGSIDPTHPGASIFTNALTGLPAFGGTYTTKDLMKTVTVTDLSPTAVDAGGVSLLTPFDTVIVYQICDIGTTHVNTLLAINSYLKNGGKVMLFDADRCAPGIGGQADYSKFLFPFSTNSPGPRGGLGCYTNVQASSLTTGLGLFCDTTFGVNDAVGDANIFTTFDPAWCASITAKNVNNATGLVEAYSRTPNGGLAIYEGEDFWFTWTATSHLRQVFDLMLKQNWNPDGLPGPGVCAPASGIKLAPLSQTQPVGSTATVMANVSDVNGNPSPGITVTFTVTAGPNAGNTGTGVTDASGNAPFSYTSSKLGSDTLQASFVDKFNNVHKSNTVTVIWTAGPAAKLVLTPKTATNTVGSPHKVTATVTDQFGNPAPGVVVMFTVSGANTATGTMATDASGKATFTYTGTKSGNDTITAQAQSGSKPSDTATKTWKPGAPAKLVLTPPTATNVVGNPHIVTATVTDAFGNPVPGATVKFTVTGANSASGTATTDASGQASFTYTGTHFGTDVITAEAGGTAKGTATKIWTLAALDNFKCYSVHARHGDEHNERVVTLSDQFGTAQVEIEEPRIFCNPASYNGSTIITRSAHLKGYQIESRKEFRERFVEVTNKFGTQTLEVEERAILAEPASKALPGKNLGPVPITLNNFECYRVEGKGKRPAPTATITDQFGKATVAVRRPVLLCNPTKKNTEGIGPVASGPDHLVCYAITPRPNTNHPVVLTRDQFGVETLRIIRPELLCVPSNKKEIPRPPHEDKD